MIDNLENIGYKQMTPIQAKSLPFALADNDLIAKAKTGSGKTAAFGIGLLEKLDVKNFRIQSLILCPTRELADQVAKQMRKLARFKHNIKITTLCGGMPYKPQVHSLSHQAHIIVGTPGRVLKHLKEKSFSPKEIKTLVLDEADRMLDMGFYDEINSIIDFLPKKRQTLLFSATYLPNIEKLSRHITINPIYIETDTIHDDSAIEELFYKATDEEKKDIVLKLLCKYSPESTLIFCNTKIACENLADELYDSGINILVLHSGLDQKERNETLILFSNKSYRVLIATDVASRGLDINDIELIINYDLPDNTEIYTHRIGRTARAGKSGHAVSLVNDVDMELFKELKTYKNLEFDLLSHNKLKFNENLKLTPKWQTIYINGGKKNKMRAGDILGALTSGIGISANDVGKIDILEYSSYVAIKNSVINKVYKELQRIKIKGKNFKVYLK